MSIPVFFTPLMVADSLSYSPSAAKPAQVVDFWLNQGAPLQIISPQPVTRQQLYSCHQQEFVDQILDGHQTNGFGNRSLEVAASLPYTCGSMLAASRFALDNGKGAVSPSSGFHHAGYDFAGGFCTFNGLMVTALTLLLEKRVNRIAILDLDMHWGNGTDNIITHFDLKDVIQHYSHAPEQHHSDKWLKSLPDVISQLLDQSDLLIYQAGADSHINDPLGGYLDTEQMMQRDEIVFSTARQLGIPIAWNLAGGYQRNPDGGIRPVLDLHYNTLKAFTKITMGIDLTQVASIQHSAEKL
jgi:acetoin utilization deacetylase AcuC-like enzyme